MKNGYAAQGRIEGKQGLETALAFLHIKPKTRRLIQRRAKKRHGRLTMPLVARACLFGNLKGGGEAGVYDVVVHLLGE